LCKQEGNATLSTTFEFKESTLPDYVEFTARFILFAISHSLCATNRVKQFVSRIAGREPRFYRLGYNLASLAMLVWVMAAYRTSPVLYFAPGIWSLVMYAAQIVIAGIIFQCVCHTGAGNFLGTSQLKSTNTQPYHLVTSGSYAHMRHPLYFYSTIFLVLNPVMTGQWLLLTICSLIYFIIGGLIEERRLLKLFDEEYRTYQQQVPFMIPVMRRIKP
jgi:protein-S-isoprenylcysteine O-methyltransferase Ste14